MNAELKIKKAKVQLIMEQPFFASLALRFKYVADLSIKTAVTDGINIWYNPEYIDSISTEEVKGVIAHEIMHVTMLHHTRRNQRNIKRWNDATDYAINPLLLASKFNLPSNVLVNPDFEGRSAEYIYERLPQDDYGDENERSNGEGTGDVLDLPNNENRQQTEAQIKQAIAQATLIAEKQGCMPCHLKRMVEDVLEPKISWQEVLTRFLSEVARNDYSWIKPSPRYLSQNLYLPILESIEVGRVTLIVDTSSSISNKTISQFSAEVFDIVNTFNIGLDILYVDAEVQSIQRIEQDEPIHLEPKGGGGTDFKPGFVYIEEHDLQPKAVVYLTDGCCNSFPQEPDMPVLWAKVYDYEFNPPFGEVICIV
ncbi:VWA-like domain-containing protein [Paraflavitalea sp. CAU 1676]|uniref:vWA domain-containing protein n=1 Tax=Paraflavitalea sp. CAU 1676 TaxID=3032598 RepID=UPI0023DA17C5|nr:VWA-like domain-containing protein [Paraflavitalea sp. CAU 1676]MDF2190497.1 VWA-like domain-containing protein [Paraflavitalea sp. CAU 1676]